MLTLIKNIFIDVFYVYKNFLHWNLSKIIIFLWSMVLWFLAMFPFLLIIFLYWYFVDINLKELFFQVIYNSLWSDWIVNIFLYITKFLFLIAYIYWYVLLAHLSINYLKGKKIKYLSNYYFDISKIKKHFSITFFNILLLLVPVILFLVLIFTLVLIVWVEESKNFITLSSIEWESNFFTITSLVLFLISVISFIYILYRICFSYFVFIDDTKNSKRSLDYIKKSFSLTKWWKSLWRFIIIMLIISPFIFIIQLVWGYLENETSQLNNYLAVKDITPEEEEYLKTTVQYTYYQSLILKYSDIPYKELRSMSTKNDVSFLLFSILNFIFIYGVFTMILSSFYKRELLK